jgi:hypothetical protein
MNISLAAIFFNANPIDCSAVSYHTYVLWPWIIPVWEAKHLPYLKQVFCRNPFCLCETWGSHRRDFEIYSLWGFSSRNLLTPAVSSLCCGRQRQTGFFWMLADLYQTTCCHISEDSILSRCLSATHGCYTDESDVWGKLDVFCWIPVCSGVATITATSPAAKDTVVLGHYTPALLTFASVFHPVLSLW